MALSTLNPTRVAKAPRRSLRWPLFLPPHTRNLRSLDRIDAPVKSAEEKVELNVIAGSYHAPRGWYFRHIARLLRHKNYRANLKVTVRVFQCLKRRLPQELALLFRPVSDSCRFQYLHELRVSLWRVVLHLVPKGLFTLKGLRPVETDFRNNATVASRHVNLRVDLDVRTTFIYQWVPDHPHSIRSSAVANANSKLIDAKTIPFIKLINYEMRMRAHIWKEGTKQ